MLRAEARGFGLDRDLWRCEFGEDTVFGFTNCEQAVTQQRNRKCEHDAAEADCECDESGLRP